MPQNLWMGQIFGRTPIDRFWNNEYSKNDKLREEIFIREGIPKIKKEELDEEEIFISRDKQKKRRLPWKVRMIFCLIILIVLIVMGLAVYMYLSNLRKKPEIITEANLQKVVNVSNLSTFEANYDGVATVMNEKDPDKVDYYVSYRSKVKAGIDFSEIKFRIESGEDESDEKKTITVTLPEITISEPSVDIASLDYMFMNKRANDATVSQEAYKACIKDAAEECAKEEMLRKMAEQNAENVVMALIKPFVEQADGDYDINIQWGGATDEE